MTAESVIMLLINKVSEVWDENLGENVTLGSPIERWKKLIGDMDPEVAKN